METYRYISVKKCSNPNCPVLRRETFEADEKGGDEYRVYKNTGTALRVFRDQSFAACFLCHSHVLVEKVL